MERKIAKFLVSEQAKHILHTVRNKFKINDEFKIVNFLDKSRKLSIEERTIIMEQLTQEVRAKSKLTDTSDWFFERTALEQASSFPVSVFHRFLSRLFLDSSATEYEILDGCAGLGIDSYFHGAESVVDYQVFADSETIKILKLKTSIGETTEISGFANILLDTTKTRITSIERNEALYVLMLENLSKLVNCECLNIDVLDFLAKAENVNKFVYLFFDPSRRTPDKKRIQEISDYSPSPNKILEKLSKSQFDGNVGFKLAPKITIADGDNVFEDACSFTVSYKNEIKETFVLHTGDGIQGKFAVALIMKHNSVGIFLICGNSQKIFDLPEKLPEVDNCLIHPAPALRSMSLTPPDLLERSEYLSSLSFETPLIQSNTELFSNIAQTYKIKSITKPVFSEVKKELHKLNCYAFSIKSYGVNLSKTSFDKLAKVRGKPVYLFFVRTSMGVKCLITELSKDGVKFATE